MQPLVTVITPTTGAKTLVQAIESVKNQTYKNIQHLVVVDGNYPPAQPMLSEYPNVDKIWLPYSTGKDRFNGHRIYGASIYLMKGEYVCFLDEDNWYDENHIDSLVKVCYNQPWAFSLRKIMSKDGKYICNDDCESLGNWPSIINDQDYFVDVGCYFLHRDVALQTSSLWYRKAREPGVPEIDRILSHVLRQNNMIGKCSGEYTLNYRTGNTQLSVQKDFFLQGNIIMAQRYKGEYPWKKI